MSNFICSECGTTFIDCGGAGYKTLKEIELEKKLEIATKALVAILVENPHNGDEYWDQDKAQQALKEMEGVK